MIVRVFGLSVLVSLAALAAAFLYRGWTGLALCAILGILEVSLSFDNAIVNANKLDTMAPIWRRRFWWLWRGTQTQKGQRPEYLL